MTPESVANESRAEVDFNVSQVWLDALSRGTCDEEAFLRAVHMLTRRSPEAAWDSLALLDQYYRRGKIKPEVFRRVKSRLGNQLLGPALDVEHSVPLHPSATASAPAAIVVPVPGRVPGPAPAVAAAPAATPSAAAPFPPVPPAPMTSAPIPAAVGSNSRTVPIGVEGTSIPVLNPANRPSGEAKGGGSTREVTVGEVLRGRYVIKNVLGLGGTGTVFEAIDRFRLDLPESGQRVAVKVLHTNATERTAVLTDLRREFQLLQSLSHPNIVRAHEYDRDGDTAFFTMEYLSGLSLDSVLSAHSEVVLERAHALLIIRDVTAALDHAHSRGVVHGDLNPGNIFITNDGEVRVLDFGAAHTPNPIPSVTEAAWDATAYATPRYASCQLLDGERADARDDTYSLACVLYVLLAGKHPFGELNAVQARAQKRKPARPAGLTGKQWHALRIGLAFDRQRRPAELAAWLEPFALPRPETRLPVLPALLKASPPRSRHTGGVLLALTVLALAAAGWWAGTHRDLVSDAAEQAGGELSAALSSADASLTAAWQRARIAVSSSPAAEPAPAPAAAPNPAARGHRAAAPALSADPAAPRVRSASPPAASTGSAASPSVNGSATHMAPPRAALPATTAPAASAGISPRPAVAAPPSHARIELAADTVDVPLTDPAAHVIVKRTGNLRGDSSFTWWTESGTAKPGRDFMSVKPHEEHFEDGKSTATLFVPVVADPTRQQPKSFYIVINDPGEGAALGKRTLTMVTIPPSE